MTKGVNILSIDDSKAVHAFIDQCFSTDSRFSVTHALTANQGIDFCKNPPVSFDLILLDWEMPELTGPEVLKKLRALGFTTPVIMVTTKNRPEDIQQMLESGASEYIMKPFTPDILIDKISSVLGL